MLPPRRRGWHHHFENFDPTGRDLPVALTFRRKRNGKLSMSIFECFQVADNFLKRYRLIVRFRSPLRHTKSKKSHKNKPFAIRSRASIQQISTEGIRRRPLTKVA